MDSDRRDGELDQDDDEGYRSPASDVEEEEEGGDDGPELPPPPEDGNASPRALDQEEGEEQEGFADEVEMEEERPVSGCFLGLSAHCAPPTLTSAKHAALLGLLNFKARTPLCVGSNRVQAGKDGLAMTFKVNAEYFKECGQVRDTRRLRSRPQTGAHGHQLRSWVGWGLSCRGSQVLPSARARSPAHQASTPSPVIQPALLSLPAAPHAGSTQDGRSRIT